MRIVGVFASVAAGLLIGGTALAQQAVAVPPLSADAINAAALDTIPPRFMPETATAAADGTTSVTASGAESPPSPPSARPAAAIVRLQVLLDRAGSSPGAIDGYDGDNVRKAVIAFEAMQGLPTDGILDPELLARLESNVPVVGSYTILPLDTDEITGPTPDDYADKAAVDFLGYASVAEALAEKFHMDIDLLRALNPDAQFVPGEQVQVTAYGPNRQGVVTQIHADKTLRQVRGYGADGQLLVAYPATIGSIDNPSPSGVHLVAAVAPMPNYTYNPDINFQQGDNESVLTIPPGPNGPVGTVWIDLTQPTFGIHGTPEPSLIDKTGSHGCVRLTNWDVEELSKMVSAGVLVSFVG